MSHRTERLQDRPKHKQAPEPGDNFHLDRLAALPKLGILALDEEYRVTYANKWAQIITGFDAAGILGMDFLALFKTQDRETAVKAIGDAEQEVFELTLITAKGRIKVVEFSCVILNDPSAETPVYVALRDISDRKNMERSVLETQEKLKKIAEMGDVGVIVYDQDFRIEFANQMAAEIIGCDIESLHDDEFTRFLAPDDRRYLKGLYSPLHLEEHKRLCMEARVQRVDGETKVAEICFAVSRTVTGEIKTYAYLRDLTERIRMEQELRKANEFLQNVIRSSVDGIIAADMKGNIIIFNEGAERLLGYKAEEVVGRIHITDLYPPGMAKEIMRRMRDGKEGPKGKIPTTRTTLIAKNEEHIPVLISAAITYEDGVETASVGIFTDLRERLMMQEQLEDTYKKLLRSEKLASIGKLAAGVAHEINNPLGGILMFSNMLLESAQDERSAADLKKIVEQTNRCKEIVQGLLDFARKGADERIPVSINTVIDKSIDLLKHQALFLNITIEKETDRNLPPVPGNEGQLAQVLTNLMVNAAQAMEGKGTVRIRTWTEGTPPQVRVEVGDTGCGIPDEYLEKIFDPFFSTKEPGKGTGLGLSTTYGIVKNHGGTIQVRSRVGEGAAFQLSFPLSQSENQTEKSSTE